MVEDHDIDALLVSALYGELTPADEARLARHLESHPTDRDALAGLTQTRSLVRDSRVLVAQLEPPQAVSARVLQEAARRAPAPRRAAVAAEEGRESWFFRFVRSFAAHPSMAAAAMLVLVVGVAGVMKMRDRGDFNERPVDTSARLAAPAPAQQAAPTSAVASREAVTPDPEAQGHAAAGSSAGYAVGLADGVVGGEQGVAPREAARDDLAKAELRQKAKNEAATDEKFGAKGDATVAAPALPKPAPHTAPPSKGIAVTTPQLELKEDDGGARGGAYRAADRPAKAANLDADMAPTATVATSGAANGAPGGAASGARAPQAAPVAPPPAAPVVAKKPMPPRSFDAPADEGASPSDKSAKDAGDSKVAERRADATLLAWAQAQLAQVIQLAKDNRCEDAARVAQTIATKAPEYYGQNVATNRELKQCMAYIAAERERAAEKPAAAKRAADTK